MVIFNRSPTPCTLGLFLLVHNHLRSEMLSHHLDMWISRLMVISCRLMFTHVHVPF